MSTQHVTWQPSSSLGWIDVDRDEARRMRELLGLFKTPEAIDPHGILPLQIALSDRLFPGMSTQHTRARYVLFAAWHAQRLVRQRGSLSVHEQLRPDELDLMRSLLESDDRAGVFGKRSREKTQTLPTGVYWSALQRWRIVDPDLGLSDIRQHIQLNTMRRAIGQRNDDEGTSRVGRDGRLLAVDFPPEPDGFPGHDQHLQLSSAEAEYLIERIAASCPESFLAVVIQRPEIADGNLPWSVDPEAGGQALVDARCFSELMHPARLLYTRLLVDDARAHNVHLDDMVAAIDIDFGRWLEESDGRAAALREWVDTRLDELLDERGFGMSPRRKVFVRRAAQLTIKDLAGSLASPELASEVRSIELAVKKKNARLSGGEPFRRWRKQPGRIASGRLDYRWGNVAQFVHDLSRAT